MRAFSTSEVETTSSHGDEVGQMRARDQMPQVTLMNEESKHRVKLPLYDLDPKIENCWVAPNATVGKFINTSNLMTLVCINSW